MIITAHNIGGLLGQFRLEWGLNVKGNNSLTLKVSNWFKFKNTNKMFTLNFLKYAILKLLFFKFKLLLY